MIPIAPAEIRAILEVTDGLLIHRESVIIPLGREGEGSFRFIPPSKLEITAPELDFSGWLAELPGALNSLELAGLKRVESDD